MTPEQPRGATVSVDAPAKPAEQRPAAAGRRSPEGPRATFGQLLPFLFEHKRILVVIAVLSVLGAVATLAQPLVVGQVIERVQLERTARLARVGADRARRRLVAALGLPALPAAAHGHRRRLLEPAQADRPHPAPADQRVRRPPHRRPRLARGHRHDAPVCGADPGPRRLRRQRAHLRRRPHRDGDHRPRAARPHRDRDRRLDRGRRAAQRPHPHRLHRAAGEGRRARVRRRARRRDRSARCAPRARPTARSRGRRARDRGLRRRRADREGLGARRAGRGHRAPGVAAGRAGRRAASASRRARSRSRAS